MATVPSVDNAAPAGMVESGRQAAEPRASVARSLAITVLAGGPGAEREVSLESGRAVCAALSRLGHAAVLRDIHAGDLSALDHPADFVFVALHGEFGEDGTVQRLLEDRGIPYSGSNAAASAVAIHKAETKRRIDAVGLPTPAWRLADTTNVDRVARTFPPPAVIKPVCSGSSVDLTIARDTPAILEAASRVVDRYGEALIETYVRGRELTVGILGDRALPVCEVRTRREFYDYQAKYVDDDTEYLFELDLPEALVRRVQVMSLEAHRALGCRVLSRVDWMVDVTEGDAASNREASAMTPYFLEINTIPGFTSHSLVPKAAARTGLDFDQLCQRIVELSLTGG